MKSRTLVHQHTSAPTRKGQWVTWSSGALVIWCACVLLLGGCARVPRHALHAPYAPPTVFEGGITHVVERGETLYRISKIYHIEISELMRVNNIYNPTQLDMGQRLFIPQAAAPPFVVKPYAPLSVADVRQIVGPRNALSDWRTITVHHSGTLQGNARLFDRDHRRRKMGGLFYHFVIGNGTKSPLGGVEVGWRWKKQVKANRPYDIQICLVGDFDQQDVKEGQFSSLVNLICVLQEEYGIPTSSIRRHCDVVEKHTECPGRRFPFSKLLSTLSRFER